MVETGTVKTLTSLEPTYEDLKPKRAGVNVSMAIMQQRASDTIDGLRTKFYGKVGEVNGITQQPGETLEQAVERVRKISW